MATISLTWQCGHTDSIRAKSRDHEYWERRAASEVCRDCWYDQQNTAAAEAAKAQALPTLQGTPKQIAWAETLRQAILAKVTELEAKIPASDPNLPTWQRLVKKLRIQSHASWWIDQRGYTPLEIFRRWERERQEAEREKPVSELLGQQSPPAANTVGFRPPPPAQVPEPLRPAAQDDKPPVAGYRTDGTRKIEVSDA